MQKIVNLLIFSFLIFSCNTETKPIQRQEIDFNFDWQFYKTQDNLNTEEVLTKVDWADVNLPHDWAIKTPYNQGYIVTDTTPNLGYIGWYKKELKLIGSKDQIIRLDFDGVYNNSEIYINGKKINERPSGFSAFSANLTPYLKLNNQPNIILVKVDHRAFLDSRWYNGAGIYRDVKLVKLNPTHIKKWGIGITTPIISSANATVQTEIEIENISADLSLNFKILNNENETIKTEEISISNHKTTHSFQIENPKLWSPTHPNLYSLETSILAKDGTVLDTKTERFGVRSLKYTANNGFLLNGKKTYFKGVCLHFDGGAVGGAVPDDIWKRRLKTLKKAGVNAIRTAHNPPSENFLNLCDEMGFLVQDEAFDELDYPKDKRKNYNSKSIDSLTIGYVSHFQKWGEQDLKDMILRDRNHPSIVMWSIGNEVEWTYPRYGKSSGYWNSDKKYYYDEPPITIEEMKEHMKNNPPKEFELAKTVQKLSKWVKELDTTRPVTANLVIPTVSHFSGYTDALDIVGYSYRASVYDYGHRNYPEKMILGTENWANYVEWKSVLDHDFIPGIFLWTGIYYMGETTDPNKRGGDSGLIDFAGFPTARWHQFKTLWNKEPHIYATTIELNKSDYINKKGEAVDKIKNQWKTRRWGYQDYNTYWNYKKNEQVVIEVYTNCPTTELFLNNKSLGIKKLKNFEDHVVKWIVPYTEGTLTVKGYGEKEVLYKIKTASKPTSLSIHSDKKKLKANGYNVAHIEVQLMDEQGNPVKHIDQNVTFKIEGPATLLATDNGSNTQRKSFNSNTCITKNGKVLLLIQSTKEKGNVTITATSNNCKTNSILIPIQ